MNIMTHEKVIKLLGFQDIKGIVSLTLNLEVDCLPLVTITKLVDSDKTDGELTCVYFEMVDVVAKENEPKE